MQSLKNITVAYKRPKIWSVLFPQYLHRCHKISLTYFAVKVARNVQNIKQTYPLGCLVLFNKSNEYTLNTRNKQPVNSASISVGITVI